jgi:carbamoylphosphate synthase large subunit
MTGRMVVIEMNPRVSRSSALASKATGYPIAKVAARLALGYTLAELPNDIVGTIPAAFEPSLDYVVVKIPRWNFEKFRGVEDALGSAMQSIGEVMALGRTFNEALQKALRSLEADWAGLDSVEFAPEEIQRLLTVPNSMRLFAVKAAYVAGWTTEKIYELSKIDPWFLENFRTLVAFEKRLASLSFPPSNAELSQAKRFGFSDRQLATLWRVEEEDVIRVREAMGVFPVVKMVDTCAGEFEARTPYYYVVYDDECDVETDSRRARGAKPKVVILGSGPNRIGQGIEFDYCCVHAAMALREAGYESIMVNCNPETVSTDFDVSDRLYFEPVAYEHVMAIVAKEKPLGVIFQFGGQTPLKLLHRLAQSGVHVLGTGVEAVDRAEDRERCHDLMKSLSIKHPPCAFASTREAAVREANQLGYPVLLRPPYVLGGRSMELVRGEDEILACVDSALHSSGSRALMIDKFIEGAVEVDVDCVSDGTDVVIGGIMQHIEEAGVHSGDSACILPPLDLDESMREEIRSATDAWWARIARHAGLGFPLTRVPDYAELWRRDDLVFSQTCGYPYTHGFAANLNLIATPHYDADGCAGPDYSSLVFARQRATQLSDLAARPTAEFSPEGQLSGPVGAAHRQRAGGGLEANIKRWEEEFTGGTLRDTKKETSSVAGKTAIVTGSSSGLGVVFAQALARAGACVVLAARRVEKLQEVARQIESTGGSAEVSVCDVGDSAQVEKLIETAWSRFGRVDILVNNAGIVPDGGVMPEKVPHDLFEQTVRINLLGVWYCCRAAGRTIPQHISPPRPR